MHDDRKLVEDRIARYLNDLVRPALHTACAALTVTAWHVPGEPVPVAEALRVPDDDFRPFAVGEPWGGPWSTTWFRFTGRIPPEWASERVEAVIDLGFDPGRGPGGQAEGLVHTLDGRALHGLHPLNRAVLVSPAAQAGAEVDFLVEAAANPGIDGAHGHDTHFGDRATAGDAPLYRLVSADLAVRDEQVWQLIHDVEVLDQLMRELDPRPRAGTRSCVRWSAPRTRPTPGTCQARRARPAPNSPTRSPVPRTPPHTGSVPWATRTSTRPGCGRSVRRYASACAPSRTSSRWPKSTPS